jgi:hypothetical protein
MGVLPSNSARSRLRLSPRVPARLCSLAFVALAATLAWVDVRRADPDDLVYFLDSGNVLLSSAWADAYADADLQVGPLFLLALAVAGRVATVLSIDPLQLVGLVTQVVGVSALGAVALWIFGQRRHGLLAAAAVVSGGVLLGLPQSAYGDGHPAQLFIPLLWLVAGKLASDGRFVLAGACVGASALLETWGILGVVALFAAPRVRSVPTAVLIAFGTAVAGYLPFAALGSFAMFEYSWVVSEGTLVSVALEPQTPFPWPYRLLQGAAAVGVGLAVAAALRRTSHAVATALAATLAVRLMLDPTSFSWYWLGVQTVILFAAIEFFTSETMARAFTRSAPATRVPASNERPY